MKKIIIAIDGYSSSGKSTMARSLAKKIGYRYIDSGAMYRAVTLYAIRHRLITPEGKVDEPHLEAQLPSIHIDFQPTEAGQATLLNGECVEKEIRGLQVSGLVSEIAAIPAVRHALVAMQQAMGREKGIVMDGRDIGTTVYPQAEMKVFVDASAETRAQRRYEELKLKGEATTYEAVLENVRHRDHIDTTRKESPLRCAADTVRLDNSTMTIEEQDAFLINLFNSIVNQ
ncbi:MAG: (d)CMP kinase [Bacteroidales bacterium]|nr:(d)CMP kinase [Bacteroidales bacterium]